ncbi:MAG TPA: methionyl-tRNA formyltransferase [Acidimicrobiales bacterium]|nr:methionyl-tRNA formyltransferase [Acidimicrobiales bacterium]
MVLIAPPPERPRRLVFMGSPDEAVPALEALVDAGFDIPLVITREDRRRGRRSRPSPTPVKAAALGLGLEVGHDLDASVEVGAELGVVVAYGRIIPGRILDRLPMVNIHFSLLPRWRGAAPVERALMAGDRETGVCLMAMERGLDTGPVYACESEPIGSEDTTVTLKSRLARRGAQLLVERLSSGLTPPTAQVGESTYAAKVTSDDLRIDWALPAEVAARLVRVGGAWTRLAGDGGGDGEKGGSGPRLKIHRARHLAELPSDLFPVPTEVGGTGAPGTLTVASRRVFVTAAEGFVELLEVQPEGRGRQRAADWVNGARVGTGDRLW